MKQERNMKTNIPTLTILLTILVKMISILINYSLFRHSRRKQTRS